jgi:hypothetical protein
MPENRYAFFCGLNSFSCLNKSKKEKGEKHYGKTLHEKSTYQGIA